MSLLNTGFLAHNPASKKVAETPAKGDGYSTINDYFDAQETTCDNIIQGIDEAIIELNKPISVTMEEVDALLDQVYAMADQERAEESILKPVFMSVVDGSIRSFKVSSQFGLTPSQILEECERFNYDEKVSTTHSRLLDGICSRKTGNGGLWKGKKDRNQEYAGP